jgi:predicted HicB family RNase H-like nuclease
MILLHHWGVIIAANVDKLNDARDYMNLPYNFIIKQIEDESGLYFHTSVLELDGCQSTGDTLEEAYSGLREAMEGWIETKLENGFVVPLPLDTGKFSGKFVLRLPKTLHARLALEAEKEGVSLNQYALYKLSCSV